MKSCPPRAVSLPPLHQSGINMDKHTYFNWQTQWHCKRWYFLKTETPPMTHYHWHEAPSLVDCVNPNLKTDHTVYIYTYNHSKTNKMIWSGQLVVNSSNIPTQPTREVLKDHHIETNQPTYLPPYRPRPETINGTYVTTGQFLAFWWFSNDFDS